MTIFYSIPWDRPQIIMTITIQFIVKIAILLHNKNITKLTYIFYIPIYIKYVFHVLLYQRHVLFTHPDTHLFNNYNHLLPD